MYQHFILLILFLTTSTAFVGMHDVHISKGQLRYDVEDRTWQLSLHLYVDDLEKDLKHDGISLINIATENEPLETDSLIQVYINKHLHIVHDDIPLAFHFVGKEKGDELLGLWVYAETSTQEMPKSFSLKNSLMINSFSDQQNILKIEAGEFSTYVLFSTQLQQKTWEL